MKSSVKVRRSAELCRPVAPDIPSKPTFMWTGFVAGGWALSLFGDRAPLGACCWPQPTWARASTLASTIRARRRRGFHLVRDPYRTEWRYGFLSHKLIALDAGHVCQNLYLAATAIGAGVCAIDAYDQRKIDAAIGVDGRDELTVYCATGGQLP